MQFIITEDLEKKQAKREGGTRKSSASKQLIGLSEFLLIFPRVKPEIKIQGYRLWLTAKQPDTLHTNTDWMDPRSLASNTFFFSFRACQAFFLLLLCFCEPRLLAHTPGSDANSSRCRNMATWYRCCINFAFFFLFLLIPLHSLSRNIQTFNQPTT